jgi:hypothetical protein
MEDRPATDFLLPSLALTRRTMQISSRITSSASKTLARALERLGRLSVRR